MSAGYRPRRPMNRRRPPEETRAGQAVRQREGFRRIVEAVPVQAAAERYGLKLDRQGFCCCPFHAEDTPSFKVYPSSGGFYCFGCGAGGDVIALTARLLGLRPIEAARRLDADFGLGIFGDENPDSAPHSEAQPDTGRRCGPEDVRPEEIHAALSLIYRLPRPKPGQHEWASQYALMMGHAEILEYERTWIYDKSYIDRCRDKLHPRGLSDPQRAVLRYLHDKEPL